MDRFKFDAFLEEFPFLQKILVEREKEYVYASRNKPAWREEVESLLENGWQFADPSVKEFFLSGEEPPEIGGKDIWLKRERLISPREIDSIKIRRADANFLRLIPTERYGDGLEEWDDIHFVMSDGKIMQNAVARTGEDYETGEVWKGETILEALASLPDDPDNVTYIVRERYYRGYGVEYEVEIYKPQKGAKFSDLIAKAREQARAEVKAEADF